MSKKFKSQASSARAASSLTGGFGFGSSFQTSSSPLTYVTELPDLSQISEPTVVVAFKNLGKKDGTTKQKALEELQVHCSGNVEQAILEAWVDIYPRTSIDNSRRVRQLAHTLQGDLTASTGKRIAPLLPRVIGSWLAGIYDSDKSVAKAAQDAVEKAFNTPEKRKALWNIYKDAIIDHIEDAVTVQTVKTLSDERTTSDDDAQAKYVRVIGTALNLMTRLMRDRVQNEVVNSLLVDNKTWSFVTHEDPYLRRSICDMAIVASEGYTDRLDWTLISTAFLANGLNSNQAGSSKQYSTALLALTRKRASLWTADYSAKTPILRRLIQFMKKGSQGGTEEVWSNIIILIRLVPQYIWLGANKLESAASIAEAIHSGVTQPAERINAVAAWSAYIQACSWLIGRLDSTKSHFFNQQLEPILKQHVTKLENAQWNVPTRTGQMCTGILMILIQQDLLATFDTTWMELVSITIEKMRLSQPESSKDFRTSQESVIEQATRLFGIKDGLSKEVNSSQAISTLQRGDDTMINAAIHLLRTRNGKPYGAAGIIEIISLQPAFDKQNIAIQNFLKDDMPALLNSPSAERLSSVALRVGRGDIIEMLLNERSANTDAALCRVLTIANSKELQKGDEAKILEMKVVESTDRQIMVSVMRNPKLGMLHSMLLKRVQTCLSWDSRLDMKMSALSFLQELLGDYSAAKSLHGSESQEILLPDLLIMADLDGELSEIAQDILSKIKSMTGTGSSSTAIVQQQLSGEGKSLSTLTLIGLAKDIINTEGVDPNILFPTHQVWRQALLPHICRTRSKDLSVSSSLQGVVYAITAPTIKEGFSVLRDSDDLSLAFRLTVYVTRMLTPDLTTKLRSEVLQDLYSIYPVALQLVNENLTLENANEMWIDSKPEVVEEAVDILSAGNKLIQSWLSRDDFVSYWMRALHQVQDSSPESYLVSLTWLGIVSQHLAQNGPAHFLQEYSEEMKSIQNSKCLIRSAALTAGLGAAFVTITSGKRLISELVASATQLDRGTIDPLLLLNLLLDDDTMSLATIPNQRIVFLLKSLVGVLDTHDTPGMQAESLKLLANIIPLVQDIYGEHWEQILASLTGLWAKEIDVPTMYSSVRLYARLKNILKDDDVNEDFREAWENVENSLGSGLLECLKVLAQFPGDINQPRTITAQLIRRQVSGVESKDTEDLFTLLASPIDAVREAAYEILHRSIPQQQEQLSIEMLLEKQKVQLSPQLLSVLSENHNDGAVYMLAWKLVFDHFSQAAHKLQEAYNSEIKALGQIEDLLEHICHTLGIVDGRPVDAGKFEVTNFDVEQGESSDRQLVWLAIHNYYNALLYVPNLVKDWFIAQKNRVKSPLEAWTQKYISPHIITASLSSVTEWASTQTGNEEEKSLTIKSSPRASELTASIAVDPESPPISLTISLPGSYPLESPNVTSRARVGVSEKNWQSWLRTIQIIILTSGSIVEGLIAFKRNVQGAMKGQNECAICYSIIGTDMQTPNKKCGTCKNNFHGTCLFRWFRSSNSSSCPLCRNNFNYA